MITRCEDLLRGTQIKFLPTRCRTFGLVVELGAQMGAKRGSGALLSIDFRPPWGGSAASIHHGRFPHFSPCDCSFFIVQRGKRTAEPLIALSMPSRPSRDWRSATLKTIVHHVQSVSWRPSTASVTMAPQGGRWRSEARSPALQEPIFDHFWAPNSANTQKKRKVIG